MGDEERIWETCIGRPVSVERTRRWVRDLCVVKRKNSGLGVVMIVFVVVVEHRMGVLSGGGGLSQNKFRNSARFGTL